MIHLNSIQAQPTSKQCLSIDFESLPDGSNLVDGMVIYKQYFDEFGVTFELENGMPPVLAKVGGIRTAFSSPFGNDQPKPEPDQGIGTFFITDDGKVNDLTAIPLIVRFNNPVDSVSAVVLDMDFGEVFTVTARGINDETLFSKTVTAGDPGTGDGVATLFGFNLDGCEGAIYSLRFQGTRVQGGGFGFGMDNFNFCFSGIDIENNISFDIVPPTCIIPLGKINILNNSTIDYLYSIDNLNFFPIQGIENLSAGEYTIFIKSPEVCQAEFVINVPKPDSVYIADYAITVVPTNCGLSNGSVEISPHIDGNSYSLSYLEQSSPTYDQLEEGQYNLVIKNEYECTDSIWITIDPSFPIELKELSKTKDLCEEGVGTAVIEPLRNGNYEFSLGNHSNETGIFDGLSAGTYEIHVQSDMGCMLDTSVIIEASPAILLQNVSTTLTDCIEITGSIEYSIAGGTGQIETMLNEKLLTSNWIYNLAEGEYLLLAKDELGCELRQTVKIDRDICPVLGPNIISTSVDGENHFVSLHTLLDYDAYILKYMIFDRWGSKIFSSGDFHIHGNTQWWDGYFNGIPAETDVYVYLAEILHPNGTIQYLTGDVTLVK